MLSQIDSPSTTNPKPKGQPTIPLPAQANQELTEQHIKAQLDRPSDKPNPSMLKAEPLRDWGSMGSHGQGNWSGVRLYCVQIVEGSDAYICTLAGKKFGSFYETHKCFKLGLLN